MPQNTVSLRPGHEIDRLTGTNNTAAVTDKYDYRLTSLSVDSPSTSKKGAPAYTAHSHNRINEMT
jgi:hypothetical protein